MEVHECGESKSYSFYGFSLHDLCECDHESNGHTNDCCKDKKSIVKAEYKDKMTNKVIISKMATVECEVPSPAIITIENSLTSIVQPEIFRTEFPPGNAPPLYILYHVFLI
jgi:hypothetical protein